MDRYRRVWVLSLLLLVSLLARAAAQAPVAPAPGLPERLGGVPRVSLTPEQMEVFLLQAKVIARKVTDKGVTKPIQATLSDGTFTHDAQIQAVDESKAIFQAGKASEVGFRDTYKFNIAGYRLARILGLHNVPMSVERRIDGRNAAMTWWIDDVRIDETGRVKRRPEGWSSERVSKQMHVMRVWDALIQNRDRNQGNMLWTSDWTLWMIDHTRAFRTGDDLLKADELTRCDRALLERLRALTAADLAQVASGGMLTKDEADAVLRRRDRLVKHFDSLIAKRGEVAVLFTQ
jgi:hypothetical protein